MSQAARLLGGAQEVGEAAAKKLVATLKEAEAGSPTDPGALAGLTRLVTSFGTGFVQRTVGMAEGMRQLAALGYRLSSANAALNSDDFHAAWGGVSAAMKYVKDHPGEALAAFADVHTLREDPARWIGKLAPEVILTVLMVGAAGASRWAATSRLNLAAGKVLEAERIPLGPSIGAAQLSQNLRALGLNSSTPAGQAATAQLLGPLGKADHRVDVTLRPGQRIVLHDPHSEFGAIFSDTITRDAQEWFEGLEVAPMRDAVQGQPSSTAVVS